MTTAAPELSTDIAALTRLLLNIEAPVELQAAARASLTPPPVVTQLHPTHAPGPAVTAAAAFVTTPPPVVLAPPVVAPVVVAPAAEPIAEEFEEEAPVVVEQPEPVAASRYLDDREAARAVLEQLSFLDD